MFTIYKVNTDKGATLLEYLLLASLITLVCLVGVATVGTEAKDLFEHPDLLGAF